MKNIRMKYKLAILMAIFSLALFITTSMGAYGMISMNDSEAKLGQVSENLVLAGELDSIVLELRVNLRQIIIDISDSAKTEELIQKMIQSEQEFIDIINQLRSSELVAEDLESMALIADIESKFNQLTAERQSFYDNARLGNVDKLIQWHTSHASRHTEIQDLCDQLNYNGVLFSRNISRQDYNKAIMLLTLTITTALIAFIGFMLMGRYILSIMVRPIEDLAAASEQLAVGDTQVDVAWERQDELGALSRSFCKMVDAMKEQARLISVVSDGDYSISAQARSEKDIVIRSLNSLIDKTNTILRNIQEASAQVAVGAVQISNAAQNMATGASEQSASVVQFSAMINQVVAQANENAKNAEAVLAETTKMSNLIENSIQSIRKIFGSMEDIQQSSQKMAKVIKVIDDIAFQTNILALNAAVEAARAGVHGAGFAVVADEVRNLAIRSADAAKETAKLIDDTIRCIQEGNTFVSDTDKSLDIVLGYSAHLPELIQQISEASSRQLNSISQADEGIAQISEVVQTNSAIAEETAAGAQEMAAQADALSKLLVGLRLKKGHKAAAVSNNIQEYDLHTKTNKYL